MDFSLGKTLMALGGTVFVFGALWHFGGKYLSLGRLPGDISIERENFRFYFPLGSSILLSVLFTLIAWLVSFIRNR